MPNFVDINFMSLIWRIYFGCYEHSKQDDCNLLYPDSLDGLANSTSKLHLMQNDVLLLKPGHTVISLSKILHFNLRLQTKRVIMKLSLSEFVLDLVDNLGR